MIRAMISLFAPTHYNNYYLLPTMRIGLVFNKHELTASATLYKAYSIMVEQLLHEPYDITIKEPQSQHIFALQNIFKKIDTYDTAYISFDSTYAIFKELTIPFTDQDTIESVLHYELEPIIAFPLTDMIYDYIIIHQDTQKQLTKIMVGFIPKDIFNHCKTLCDQVKLKNLHFGIDIINASKAYKKYLTTSYHEISCWISYHNDTVKIICFEEQNLKILRTITCAKTSLLKDSPLWNDIIVTLQTFLEETTNPEKITFILDTTIDTATQAALDAYFNTKSITLEKTHFSQITGIIFNTTITQSSLFETVSTLLIPDEKTFDLTKTLLLPEKLQKQKNIIFTSIALLAAFTVIGSWHMWKTIHMYKTEINESKQQIKNELKKLSPKAKSNDIPTLETDAKREVKKEINLWSPFYLDQEETIPYYLATLCTIDNKGLGLSLKKLSITNNKIILEGSVKNFPSLGDFEKQLRKTNLFVHVETGELLAFAMTLNIKKKGTLS